MKREEDIRLADSRLVRAAPVLRGLLAQPSGSEDVPYRRVILRSLTAREARGFKSPLRMDAPDCDAAPEKFREQFAAAIREHVRRTRARPEAILLRGAGFLQPVEDPAGRGRKPLRNETALVTGAAGAIGSAICREPLKNGCRVAATDLPGQRLDRFVAEVASEAGLPAAVPAGASAKAGNRIIGVPLDVTDERSVKRAFDAVVREWGGVDIVIANAGIPLIASLVEMDLEDFRRLEQVNVEGTLLTLAEAGRRMRLQGTGGDIVVVSTKNVFSPARASALTAPPRPPRTSSHGSPASNWPRSASA